MIRNLLLFVGFIALSGCTSPLRHAGTVTESGSAYSSSGSTYVSSHESKQWVRVVAEFREYQFVRSSKSGFIGCSDALNQRALERAEANEKSIDIITWQQMKEDGYIDHSRDIVSAIMVVQCQWKYDYKSLN